MTLNSDEVGSAVASEMSERIQEVQVWLRIQHAACVLDRRERRVRSVARSRGMRVEKSHTRNPSTRAYGTYRLSRTAGPQLLGDPETEGYGISLDEIEKYLFGY